MVVKNMSEEKPEENITVKVTKEYQKMMLKRKYDMYKHARNSLDKLLIISNFVREIKGEMWIVERRYSDVVTKNDTENIKSTIDEIQKQLEKLYDLILNL